jgi:hypothetical protein
MQEVAYCGIDCGKCPAYEAKRDGNEKLKVETAAKWNSPQYPVLASDIECDGCRRESGQMYKYCHVCDIRRCAKDKEYDSCASCPDYACTKLTALFTSVGPDPKRNLERIRVDEGSAQGFKSENDNGLQRRPSI